MADLLGGVLDRIWPKKMTEEERAEAGKQFRRLLMEEKGQEIQDVISARAMAMKEAENAPYAVRLIRGLFRPYAGYLTVTVWASTVAVRFYAAFHSWAAAGFPAADGPPAAKALAGDGPLAGGGPPDLAALLTGWDFGVIMLVLGFFFGTRSFEKTQGVQNRG